MQNVVSISDGIDAKLSDTVITSKILISKVDKLSADVANIKMEMETTCQYVKLVQSVSSGIEHRLGFSNMEIEQLKDASATIKMVRDYMGASTYDVLKKVDARCAEIDKHIEHLFSMAKQPLEAEAVANSSLDENAKRFQNLESGVKGIQMKMPIIDEQFKWH